MYRSMPMAEAIMYDNHQNVESLYVYPNFPNDTGMHYVVESEVLNGDAYVILRSWDSESCELKISRLVGKSQGTYIWEDTKYGMFDTPLLAWQKIYAILQ